MLPAPHGDKLQALLENQKLPAEDRERVELAQKRYLEWLAALQSVSIGGRKGLTGLVQLLNDYRRFLDLEVVFDSPEDFLYRQKGQLKLDNTVVEEFLPRLVAKAFPGLSPVFSIGPQSCFAALYFTSTARTAAALPGARARTRDQDFSISKRAHLRTSFDPQHTTGVESLEINLG